MLALAMAIALFSRLYPQASWGESPLSNADFLGWNEETQAFYVQIAVGTAILITSQNDKKYSQCVGDWYEKDRPASEAFIFSTMKRFPDYHPTATIISVVKKKCGPFTFR